MVEQSAKAVIRDFILSPGNSWLFNVKGYAGKDRRIHSMSKITINTANGEATIYSNDPGSPAAPFLKEYRPTSIEQLYEIGMIPKSVQLEHLHDAQRAALQSKFSGSVIADIPSSFGVLPKQEIVRFLKARSNAAALQNARTTMAGVLQNRHGYGEVESQLLAGKISQFIFATDDARLPVWRQIELSQDLDIKTLLVIDRSINALLARNVLIEKTGELRAQGAYFLLRCNRIDGGYPASHWINQAASTLVSGASKP
jgi:hypothetical protein